MKTYTQDAKDQIRDLLVGHTVTKVSKDTLILDNGTTLLFKGHVGGCSCGAGDYHLSELNDCPINMITAVEFVDAPGSEDYDEDNNCYKELYGFYKIFVLAHDEHIKLAEFTGSDGNGYYGTGYWINVTEAEAV